MGFEGELHIIISAGQSNWEAFEFGWGRRGDAKLQPAGVGKLNGWVFELSFLGRIIHFKFLFWILYSFIEFIYFSIYLHLFIYSFIDIFISGWFLLILLIVNRQSNLIIYIEFVLYKFCYVNYFYIYVFACVFVCAYFY